MYKIIGADGKEYGPVSIDQLKQWMTEGRVNAQTQLLAEGATEWKPLSAYPELQSAPAGAAPITPIAPPSPMGAFATPARDQVSGPAIGLIVTAILGCLMQVLSIVMNVAGASFMAANRSMPSEAWANMFSGTFAVVAGVIGILVSALILLGAIKMKKLENYGLAMVASIVAMIPCISPCCVLGLPIGIWAVVVLSKPEVKSAFH